MCNRTPLSPTTIEATAMTAGPVRKRTAIAKEATEFPHAIIFGCNAMNNPTNTGQGIQTSIQQHYNQTRQQSQTILSY